MKRPSLIHRQIKIQFWCHEAERFSWLRLTQSELFCFVLALPWVLVGLTINRLCPVRNTLLSLPAIKIEIAAGVLQ